MRASNALQECRGRTILEVLGVLALLVVLTLGGVQVFSGIYADTMAKNLTEDVVRRAVVRQHALLKNKGSVEEDIIEDIGPHDIPIHEENGTDGSTEDTFWIMLGNFENKVSKKICDRLLARTEELKASLKLLGVFVDDQLMVRCPKVGGRVKYVFPKKSDREVELPSVEINGCENRILCPPHATCTENTITCMEEYSKIRLSTCNERCVPCDCVDGKCTCPAESCGPDCTGEGCKCSNNKCDCPPETCVEDCGEECRCFDHQCKCPAESCGPDCAGGEGCECVDYQCTCPASTCGADCGEGCQCVDHQCTCPAESCGPDCAGEGCKCVENQCTCPASTCGADCGEGCKCVDHQCTCPVASCGEDCGEGCKCVENQCTCPASTCGADCGEGCQCVDGKCTCPPERCGEECDEDCSCVEGVCTCPCADTGSCETGMVCEAGLCQCPEHSSGTQSLFRLGETSCYCQEGYKTDEAGTTCVEAKSCEEQWLEAQKVYPNLSKCSVNGHVLSCPVDNFIRGVDIDLSQCAIEGGFDMENSTLKAYSYSDLKYGLNGGLVLKNSRLIVAQDVKAGGFLFNNSVVTVLGEIQANLINVEDTSVVQAKTLSTFGPDNTGQLNMYANSKMEVERVIGGGLYCNIVSGSTLTVTKDLVANGINVQTGCKLDVGGDVTDTHSIYNYGGTISIKGSLYSLSDYEQTQGSRTDITGDLKVMTVYMHSGSTLNARTMEIRDSDAPGRYRSNHAPYSSTNGSSVYGGITVENSTVHVKDVISPHAITVNQSSLFRVDNDVNIVGGLDIRNSSTMRAGNISADRVVLYHADSLYATSITTTTTTYYHGIMCQTCNRIHVTGDVTTNMLDYYSAQSSAANEIFVGGDIHAQRVWPSNSGKLMVAGRIFSPEVMLSSNSSMFVYGDIVCDTLSIEGNANLEFFSNIYTNQATVGINYYSSAPNPSGVLSYQGRARRKCCDNYELSCDASHRICCGGLSATSAVQIKYGAIVDVSKITSPQCNCNSTASLYASLDCTSRTIGTSCTLSPSNHSCGEDDTTEPESIIPDACNENKPFLDAQTGTVSAMCLATYCQDSFEGRELGWWPCVENYCNSPKYCDDGAACLDAVYAYTKGEDYNYKCHVSE